MCSIGSPTFNLTLAALGYRDGFLGAAARHAPGIGVAEDFADRQPGGARRSRESDVHDQFFPDHLLDVVEQPTLKPADSQILAEACINCFGSPANAPNRIISIPL
jgi:hypothetical protein